MKITDAKEFDLLWKRLQGANPPAWEDIYALFQQTVLARTDRDDLKKELNDLKHKINNDRV